MERYDEILRELVADLPDPEARREVYRTVYYLYGLWRRGEVRESQVREALADVCMRVIKFAHPELTDEEIEERGFDYADRFIESFKTYDMFAAIRAKLKLPGV